MSTDPGTLPPTPPLPEEFRPITDPDQPKDWKEAVACLVSSRITIIREESKDVAGPLVRKIAFIGIAAFCAITAWAVLWAGVVGAITAATGWAWFISAFAVAGLHLLIAGILIALSRSKPAESFPITREEFKKDREWLNQLKQQRK